MGLLLIAVVENYLSVVLCLLSVHLTFLSSFLLLIQYPAAPPDVVGKLIAHIGGILVYLPHIQAEHSVPI